jgi:pyrroline-5-carboxylate reductase
MNNQATSPIAFIGGGNMARALIGGLLRQGVPAQLLRVGEPDAGVRAALERDLSVATCDDNALALRDAGLVVLAVKPQTALAVLQGMRAALLAQAPVLLSIVAGLRMAELTRACGGAIPIVRAMPNRPALIGAGITGLYAAVSATATQRNNAERVATAAGRTVWLRSESELDIVTAVSGSGPAYCFLLAEHLARAGESLGLERDTALLLARETLYGAGALVHDTAASLAEQRVAVTSKGGTTEAALQVFKAGGFEALVVAAVVAAAARSGELAGALAAALAPPSGTGTLSS